MNPMQTKLAMIGFSIKKTCGENVEQTLHDQAKRLVHDMTSILPNEDERISHLLTLYTLLLAADEIERTLMENMEDK